MFTSEQRMCVAFFVACLIPIWGVLYAFWLSFEAFPVISCVWDMDLDKVCTLPNASLSVVPTDDSVFVYLRSVGGANAVTLVGNRSSFDECTLLDTLVYLRGGEGGLCLAFSNKVQADAFVASIGFKDVIEGANTEDGNSENGDSKDDDFGDGDSEDDNSEDDNSDDDDSKDDDSEDGVFEDDDSEDGIFEDGDTQSSCRGTPTIPF